MTKHSVNRLFVLAISAATLGAWSNCLAAISSAPNVAIVAAATNSNIMSERFTDLRDVLDDDGRFGTIDIISTTRFGTGTPTLSDLLAYDAVIHWSNDSNDDAIALGNVLADYVDTGRGMVQAVFANTSTNADRYLQGRWITDGYNIIPPMGGFTQGTTVSGIATDHAVMAPPLEPAHPIFDGISDVRLALGRFNTGGLWGGYRPTTTALEPGARKLALWEDGKTAVAVSDLHPNRVELGFHPVSNLVADGYYELNSDTPKLIANALLFSAGHVAMADFDIDNDGSFTCADIDQLISAIAQGIFDVCLDFNGDGIVDLLDRDEWLAGAGNATIGAPFLPGDANLDGVVDGQDFLVWNENKFENIAEWCRGDFNADGVVDGPDFLTWNSFKFQSSDAFSAVPEGTGSFPLIGLACFIWLRRVHR